ncbi:uncharacterized protein LOC142347853 [Convolutriloba macropyga]|uniref:uncharacterized protein LOC142347853 n=1 Tax=Convolutriloba macropyga TaxID=536237 RepID=UPI003F5218EE
MAHSTAKPLLRRPLAAKDSKAGTGEAAKAIDGLVEDLNDIFDRNLSDIYQTAEDNSSYAQDDSPSERSYDSYPHVENRQPSPRTAYLKSMMRKKGSRAREFTEEDMYQFGSYNSNAGLHQPFRVRGPKPFHTSHSIKQPSVVSLAYLNAFEESQQQEYRMDARTDSEQQDHFTLGDFQQPVPKSRGPRLVRSAIKEAVLSRHNYNKLTKLFADTAFKTEQNHVHQIYFSGEEVEAKANRIPWRQLVLEMAAILQEEAATMRENVATAQKAYNKFLKTAKGAAEMVGKAPDRFDNVMRSEGDVYQYTTAKFFENIERSDSPIEKVEESALITSDELAVLDAMVCGGVALSLKAQFLKKIPDISPLYNTMKYLNLSFNELRSIPDALFELKQLEILKMRSNPITELPQNIGSLSKLKCIVMAYCNIKTIPLTLFSISTLEIVDFRYNVLTFMPPEVKNLKNLREINVEGNQLTYMPCGLLRLKRVTSLGVRNNFMHPLLWRNLTKGNNVQSLKDLCCVIITRNRIDIHSGPKKVPSNILNVLEPDGVCDCCGSGMFGDGLRVVRPARRIFGTANVPFLFTCCSPYCMTEFNANSGNTAQYIYREEAASNE